MSNETFFQNDDLVAVPIAEFISGKVIPVDLYIRLSDEKYVLVVKAGSQTELERLRNYAQKDVEDFYVKKEEYTSYVEQNITIAGILVTKSKLSGKQKTTVLSRSTNAVFEEIGEIGFSQQSLTHARKISDSMVTLVDSKADFSTLLNSLNSVSNEMVRHSVAVSIVSSMIGRAIGWTKAATIEKLALGGILHDIGKKELPADIFEKPRAKLSFDEVVLYESHPYRGMQLLQTIPSVPEDVLAMAYEHHENNLGQGFPRRLRDLRMNPLARITALANAFCDLTLSNVNNQIPRSAAEAVKHIELVMGKPFNKEAFAALKRMVRDGEL